MDFIDIETPEQVIEGPKGLKLKMDAGEIYPNDPGLGTPLLLQYKKAETMTWGCGYEGGNFVEIIPAELIDEAKEWLDEIADEVSEWETFWWDKKSK